MRQLDSSRTASSGADRVSARPIWWRELVLILGGYGLYHEAQIHSPSAAAFRHGAQILRAERWTHLDFDRSLNHVFAAASWLAVPAGYYYATLHFAVTIGVLAWLWVRHPDSYPSARRVIVAGTLMALAIFWAFPAAPPRLLFHAGFVDTAARFPIPIDLESGRASKAADLFATMPSLHFAWALWCAWAVSRVVRTPATRRLVWVYPALTAVVVLGTANHFVLDLVGGAAVLAAAAVVALWLPGQLRRAWASGPRALRLAVLAGPVLLAGAVAGQSRFVGESLHAMSHLRPLWVVAAVLAELGSMTAFSRLHRRALRITGVVVRRRTAQAINYASNAVSATVPLVGSAAGAANTWRQYRKRGAPAPAITWALGAAGVASALAFTLLMGVGAVVTGNPALIGVGAGLTSAGLVSAVLLWAGARREGVRRRAERLVAAGLGVARRKAGAEAAPAVARQFIDALASYRPRVRDVTMAMAAALLNWGLSVVCLAASIHAVHGHIPPADLIAIWAAAGGAALVSLTPSGLGIVEPILVAGLVFAGLSHGTSIGATVLYRLVSLVAVAAAGWAIQLLLARVRPAAVVLPMGEAEGGSGARPVAERQLETTAA